MKVESELAPYTGWRQRGLGPIQVLNAGVFPIKIIVSKSQKLIFPLTFYNFNLSFS